MNLKSLSKLREKHPLWKGWRYIDSKGYVVVWSDFGKQHEHRMVMESHIGRKLSSKDIVHHKNEIKTDNRISNLELLTTALHNKIHLSGNKFNLGRVHTKEHIEKTSKHLFGNKHRLGKLHLNKTKEKMSDSQKKRWNKIKLL